MLVYRIVFDTIQIQIQAASRAEYRLSALHSTGQQPWRYIGANVRTRERTDVLYT